MLGRRLVNYTPILLLNLCKADCQAQTLEWSRSQSLREYVSLLLFRRDILQLDAPILHQVLHKVVLHIDVFQLTPIPRVLHDFDGRLVVLEVQNRLFDLETQLVEKSHDPDSFAGRFAKRHYLSFG